MKTEQIMEYVCDNLCRFPAEYKDPDDLWNEQCDHCKLRELLEEGERMMNNEERRKAAEWFRNRAKNCPMHGARRMYEIATEALEERVRNKQHGRLIDADALMLHILDYIEEYNDDLDDNGYHNGKWCAMKEAEMVINDAPTIIEAEGRE